MKTLREVWNMISVVHIYTFSYNGLLSMSGGKMDVFVLWESLHLSYSLQKSMNDGFGTDLCSSHMRGRFTGALHNRLICCVWQQNDNFIISGNGKNFLRYIRCWYFSYSFDLIFLKIGRVILWVSLHIFFSEFWNFNVLYFFNEVSLHSSWDSSHTRDRAIHVTPL